MNQKELQQIIEDQKKRIEELEAELTAMKEKKSEGKKRSKNRVYVLTDKDPATVKLPKQAAVCMGIIAAQEDKREENLIEVFKTKAEALGTKQDPWRIFQYYRPLLISHDLLRCVDGEEQPAA